LFPSFASPKGRKNVVFLPKENEKVPFGEGKKKRDLPSFNFFLWFFSFLFPQRGKLLFFSSFGRKKQKEGGQKHCTEY
jgi:hypothetical protein